MGVAVQSRAASRDPSRRAPTMVSVISRLRREASSMMRKSPLFSGLIRSMWDRSVFCVSAM